METHVHLGFAALVTFMLVYLLTIPVLKVSSEWAAQKWPIFSGLAALANA